MQELSQWLSQFPTQRKKTVMTCTPASLTALLQDHWLEALAGTTLPGWQPHKLTQLGQPVPVQHVQWIQP